VNRRSILVVLPLVLLACKGKSSASTSAPTSGLELVYTGDAITDADASIANKRLAALGANGTATVEAGKLRLRIEGAKAQAVKESLSTGGRLEFFAVDDSTSKRLCVGDIPGDVKLEKEQLRDGTNTCYFTGPADAVRRATAAVLGAAVRLEKLEDGEVRSYGVFTPPFLTGSSVSEAKAIANPGPGVAFVFDEKGKQVFAEHTRKLTDMRMAIVFDDEVLAAPLVMSEIPGGRATLSVRSEAAAKVIADAVQSGALPRLTLESEKPY
jgi:preprotein translocase subunit SecD